MFGNQRASVPDILVCGNADVGVESGVSRREDSAEWVSLLGAVCVVAAGIAVLREDKQSRTSFNAAGDEFRWLCFAAAIVLSGWAFFVD